MPISRAVHRTENYDFAPFDLIDDYIGKPWDDQNSGAGRNAPASQVRNGLELIDLLGDPPRDCAGRIWIVSSNVFFDFFQVAECGS